MRKLSNAIISNWKGEILVVDKENNNGEVYTIFPGGKVDEGESFEIALFREIDEEIGISNILIRKKIGIVFGISPSGKESEIHLFKTELGHDNYHTVNEVKNPRYLFPKEIYDLETTTDLTRKIIESVSFKTWTVMKRKKNKFN